MKITISILLALLVSTTASANYELKVRVNDVPPQYIMVNGKWVGLAVELMDTLLNEADCKAKHIKLPWKRALNELENGRIDAMMNVGLTSERTEYYYFIGGIVTETTVLVIRKDDNYPINSLEDFKSLPQKVVFERGNIFDKRFTEKFKNDEAFKNMFYPLTHSNMIDAIIHGRFTGELDILANVKYLIKTDPKYKVLKIHPFLVSELPTFFAFSKKSVSQELILKLHEANNRAISKGSYDKVINKWKK